MVKQLSCPGNDHSCCHRHPDLKLAVLSCPGTAWRSRNPSNLSFRWLRILLWRQGLRVKRCEQRREKQNKHENQDVGVSLCFTLHCVSHFSHQLESFFGRRVRFLAKLPCHQVACSLLRLNGSLKHQIGNINLQQFPAESPSCQDSNRSSNRLWQRE